VAPRPAPTPASTLLSTLEIINAGVLNGTRFRIERPVVHIGRGAHNDIQLSDESVSSSHATLSRRGAEWIVVDRGSTNGTYVDGERITGERALKGAAELRFGGIKTVFRPIAGSTAEVMGTRVMTGVKKE
jgi:pSer/pThr/pTyr-binding forkhead associated (FHA) protein